MGQTPVLKASAGFKAGRHSCRGYLRHVRSKFSRIGPEQNRLCGIADIGRESEGRVLFGRIGPRMRRPTTLPFDRMNFPLTLTDELRATFAELLRPRSRDGCRRLSADWMSITMNARRGNPAMGQAQREHRAILIVEDDAELRSLAAALFEDEQVDTIECESAEAALAIMLIGGRDVAMIFADIRLLGAMGRSLFGMGGEERWPLLPMILTSGHPREHGGELPPWSVTCPSRGSRSTRRSPPNGH